MENKESKKSKVDSELTPDEILKYQIAEELGLMDKVNSTGWKSLTSKESGQIGGIMTKRKRELKKQTELKEA